MLRTHQVRDQFSQKAREKRNHSRPTDDPCCDAKRWQNRGQKVFDVGSRILPFLQVLDLVNQTFAGLIEIREHGCRGAVRCRPRARDVELECHLVVREERLGQHRIELELHVGDFGTGLRLHGRAGIVGRRRGRRIRGAACLCRLRRPGRDRRVC